MRFWLNELAGLGAIRESFARVGEAVRWNSEDIGLYPAANIGPPLCAGKP
jgi:hypothetical protein